MPLAHPKLEEQHTELCSLLNQRREELSRAPDAENSEAAKATEDLSKDIDRWHDDAARVDEATGNEGAIAELLDRASEIASDLHKIEVG